MANNYGNSHFNSNYYSRVVEEWQFIILIIILEVRNLQDLNYRNKWELNNQLFKFIFISSPFHVQRKIHNNRIFLNLWPLIIKIASWRAENLFVSLRWSRRQPRYCLLSSSAHTRVLFIFFANRFEIQINVFPLLTIFKAQSSSGMNKNTFEHGHDFKWSCDNQMSKRRRRRRRRSGRWRRVTEGFQYQLALKLGW